MLRYVKQRETYSCGPVAIMNVCKWAGEQFAYQEAFKPLRRLCACSTKKGTKHAAFDKALRTMAKRVGGLRVRRVHRPKLGQMEKHLRLGGAVVLNFRWKTEVEDYRHFSLLTEIADWDLNFFRIVNNYQSGPAAIWISRSQFKKHNLRFQRTDPHYKAWFVSRRD